MSKQYPIARQQDPILRQHPVADHVEDVVPPSPGRPANFRRKSNILSVAVSAIVIPGLLATVALPAYAATGGTTRTERAHIALAQTVHDHAQTLYVSAAEDVTDNVDRGAFGYVAPPAPVVHRVTLAQFGSGGPVPSNLSGAAAVAAQYLGVPYVFGGESPAGFDCSGLVAYVFAQFGISLPHSSMLQGEMGTRIPYSQALPGDVVVMHGGSHVGIYIGGGRMIDAPEPGRVVSNDAIYDNNFFIVRF